MESVVYYPTTNPPELAAYLLEQYGDRPEFRGAVLIEATILIGSEITGKQLSDDEKQTIIKRLRNPQLQRESDGQVKPK